MVPSSPTAPFFCLPATSGCRPITSSQFCSTLKRLTSRIGLDPALTTQLQMQRSDLRLSRRRSWPFNQVARRLALGRLPSLPDSSTSNAIMCRQHHGDQQVSSNHLRTGIPHNMIRLPQRHSFVRFYFSIFQPITFIHYHFPSLTPSHVWAVPLLLGAQLDYH